jgi:hypothetical protein
MWCRREKASRVRERARVEGRDSVTAAWKLVDVNHFHRCGWRWHARSARVVFVVLMEEVARIVCRDALSKCISDGHFRDPFRALDTQVSNSDVLEEVAINLAQLLINEVLSTCFVNEVVTEQCSQRAAAGGRAVCQVDFVNTGEPEHLIRIGDDSVDDHVCCHEVAQLVGKHICLDQRLETGLFRVRQEIGIAEIDAAHVVRKHFWVVIGVVKGRRFQRVFVPRGRSGCCEELGPGNKEVVVECEALLLLPCATNKAVEGLLHVLPGESQRSVLDELI